MYLRAIIGLGKALHGGVIPAPLRTEARNMVLNALGCMVGGSAHELSTRAFAALSPSFGVGRSTLIGRGTTCDAINATMMNALAGAAYSYDDTFSEALLHPVGPVFAATAALAEQTGAKGSQVLGALVAGVEFACRLTASIALPPAKCDLAWSQTGLACGAGAALSSGLLLDLSEQQLESAIGLALAEASGTRATHGTMAASFIFASAASSGTRSALLAAQGFTAPSEMLSRSFGFWETFSEEPAPERFLDGLGEDFLLMQNRYKPYPCGVVIFPALDAALALYRQVPHAGVIRQVVVTVSAKAASLGDRPEPRDGVEAKFSLQHWVAAALVRGQATMEEISAASVANAEIRDIRNKTLLRRNPDLPTSAAELTVTLQDGSDRHISISDYSGSETHPISRERLEQKFAGLTHPLLGSDRSDRLLRLCDGIDEAVDLAALMAETAPPGM
jgi:2-methylcitrate dehydratase PrpD